VTSLARAGNGSRISAPRELDAPISTHEGFRWCNDNYCRFAGTNEQLFICDGTGQSTILGSGRASPFESRRKTEGIQGAQDTGQLLEVRKQLHT
jgi:hypothetical protein